MKLNRRHALSSLIGLAAGSPLFAQSPAAEITYDIPDDVTGPINIYEFEAVAKRKLHKIAYDFIAGGAENERTLRANLQAFDKTFLVPRVMVDVSDIDPSLELFGIKLASPILIAPTGWKSLVIPGADEVVAEAALASKTLLCSAAGAEKLAKKGLDWWTNTAGHRTKDACARFAVGAERIGAKAIVITADNPYQSNRDRNNRNRLDFTYGRQGIPQPGEKREPGTIATPAMWRPHTPNLSWQHIEWYQSGAKLPVIVKGVLSPEDAKLAVDHGAAAVVVSNHGARQLDGAIATLDALPEIAEVVAGRIPVLMDGGIRRGQDVLKALALGANAVLIGRAPLWGLGAFGQPGVERVLWMINAEFKLAMALAGVPNLAAINRKLVKKA
jgi:isopentenyl diphosphate isomerase/L-lactate dehydrogenase-like FMN-dependent dehydrogenase